MLLHYCCNYILHTHHFYFASWTVFQMQWPAVYYAMCINAEVTGSIIVCSSSSCCLPTKDVRTQVSNQLAFCRAGGFIFEGDIGRQKQLKRTSLSRTSSHLSCSILFLFIFNWDLSKRGWNNVSFMVTESQACKNCTSKGSVETVLLFAVLFGKTLHLSKEGGRQQSCPGAPLGWNWKLKKTEKNEPYQARFKSNF